MLKETLPYYLRDNANFAEISVNKMDEIGRTELLKRAKEKYNSYDINDWVRAYFEDVSGGYNVYHREHQY